MADAVVGTAALPRISVVTPSYNQARFLESCLRSVLDQRYPNLEYIVVDGGSTDGSAAIVERFDKHLAHWVSEPDAGHYDAVNKGFRHATGDVLAWLNSDDLYTPWTLAVVADIFGRLPEVEWLTTLYPLFWNEAGVATHCTQLPGLDRRLVLRGDARVQQESTFWRRSLWERAGGALDTSFRLAADLDLWARFWQHAELYGVAVPLGGIRRHGGQRHVQRSAEYTAEADVIARRCGLHAARRPGRVALGLRAVTGAITPRHVREVLHEAGVLFNKGLVIEQRNREGTWTVRTTYFV